MSILVFGGTGQIGKQVAEDLSTRYMVYSVGLHSGDILCHYSAEDAVHTLFQKNKNIKHAICTVGNDVRYKELKNLNAEDFQYSFERKFLAQVRLAQIAYDYLADGGSITLTSGFQSNFSTRYSIAVGPFNAALDTFVVQAAPLLKRGVRLNAVSPAPIDIPVANSRIHPCSVIQIAGSYVAAVEGTETGRIYRPWDGLYKTKFDTEFVTHAA